MSTTDAGDGSLFLDQQKPPKVEHWRIRISLYVVTFPKNADSIHQTILQTKTDQLINDFACLKTPSFFTCFNEPLVSKHLHAVPKCLGFFQLSLTTQDSDLGD